MLVITLDVCIMGYNYINIADLGDLDSAIETDQ